MRIVFVTYLYWPPHFGGELKVSIERFESLVKRGHTVTVLTSGVPGFPEEEIINGVQIKRSPQILDTRFGRGIRRLVFPIWAWSIMRGMKFDILHHGGTGGITSLDKFLGMTILNKHAQRKKAATVIVHSLADSEKEVLKTRGFNAALHIRTLWQMDCIASVSPALHAGVEQFFPGKSRLILYGVHDNLFTPLPMEKREQFRKINQVREDEVVFSFLGSVGKRKGFDLLIHAFANTIKEHPNWRLWIVGPHNKEESQNFEDEGIEALLISLESNRERIHFWGRIDERSELATILGASDIFVFPSRKEGMGIAPMEAMSCGVPVIISRISGITDQASVEGLTGRYIEVNNTDALRSAMIEMGTDAKKREKMGQAARQRIVDQFGWEKQIDEWEALYARVRSKKIDGTK